MNSLKDSIWSPISIFYLACRGKKTEKPVDYMLAGKPEGDRVYGKTD